MRVGTDLRSNNKALFCCNGSINVGVGKVIFFLFTIATFKFVRYRACIYVQKDRTMFGCMKKSFRSPVLSQVQIL